jgi:hypothetical protein
MRLSAALCLLAAPFAWAAPASNVEALVERQTTGRLVFCHFMVCLELKAAYPYAKPL